MSRHTPGMPIPGTEQTITAAEQAAALGMQPGGGPQDCEAPALSPNQARKLMSDEYPGEGVDIGWQRITISGGRDVMDALGVDPATLPVGVEAELGAPQPRPERRLTDQDGTVPAPPPAAEVRAEAEALRAKYRAHAAEVAGRAEGARGDAEKEARAAAEVREVAELGSRLKSKLEKLGLSL